MILRLLCMIFCCCSLLACKKNDQQVTVVFELKNTDGKTANSRNYALTIAKTKILFSNFQLIAPDGRATTIKDVFLYKNSSNSFTFDCPEGTYVGFRFAFGVDRITNNTLPLSYSPAHPLSIETGLYWDMLKYRFLIVEGNVDNSDGKNQLPGSPFSMHLGTDTLYTVIDTDNIPVKGSTLRIIMNADSLFVLDNDPFQITNFSNHSDPSEIARGIAIKNSFINSVETSLSLSQ